MRNAGPLLFQDMAQLIQSVRNATLKVMKGGRKNAMSEKDLDSWDKFSSNFIKAADVASENDAYVCIGVNQTEDDLPKVRLTLEMEENEYSFDLNKTNIGKLKELKIESPRKLIGKKIYFKKVLARNPSTKKEVDSLRVYKIE